MVDIEALKAERKELEALVRADAASRLRARFLDRQVGLFNLNWKVSDPAGYAALHAECQTIKAEAEALHAVEMAAYDRLHEILAALKKHRDEADAAVPTATT